MPDVVVRCRIIQRALCSLCLVLDRTIAEAFTNRLALIDADSPRCRPHMATNGAYALVVHSRARGRLRCARTRDARVLGSRPKPIHARASSTRPSERTGIGVAQLPRHLVTAQRGYPRRGQPESISTTSDSACRARGLRVALAVGRRLGSNSWSGVGWAGVSTEQLSGSRSPCSLQCSDCGRGSARRRDRRGERAD